MTEKKDEIRLKELLSVFGKDKQKELIEILHRDQIRYHQEQLNLSNVSQQHELLKAFLDWFDDPELPILEDDSHEALVNEYIKSIKMLPNKDI